MGTRLTHHTIGELKQKYPFLPNDYLDYMLTVGWGESDSGRVIYEGPIDSAEVYGPRDDLSSIILLGDDFQGYCFGYDSDAKCYGEVGDDGTWEPWPSFEGIAHYAAEPDDKDT